MTPDEADRLAHHVNLERPEWPIASLRTLIVKKLAGKPYRDALHAFIDCAADPGTNTPARVLEAGPWWGTRIADPRDKPAYYGPTATFCGHEYADEQTGQPRRCGRVTGPDGECDHGMRVRSAERRAAIEEARQAVTGAQGSVERAEGEIQSKRDAAKERADAGTAA